jgi:hypothetical protein
MFGCCASATRVQGQDKAGPFSNPFHKMSKRDLCQAQGSQGMQLTLLSAAAASKGLQLRAGLSQARAAGQGPDLIEL